MFSSGPMIPHLISHWGKNKRGENKIKRDRQREKQRERQREGQRYEENEERDTQTCGELRDRHTDMRRTKRETHRHMEN